MDIVNVDIDIHGQSSIASSCVWHDFLSITYCIYRVYGWVYCSIDIALANAMMDTYILQQGW